MLGSRAFGSTPLGTEIPTSGPAVSDSNFSNVSLLLHMDGAGGSTTFTDSSSSPKTVTPTATTLSTAQTKFGTAAASFNGTTSVLTVPNNVAFIPSADFTAEAWIYPNATISTTQIIVGVWGASGQLAWNLCVSVTNSLVAESSTSGVYQAPRDIISANNVITPNTWNHVALTRSGNTWTIWANGVSVGTSSLSGSLWSSTAALTIGAANNSAQYFNGYIDDVRMTTGVARYSSNFTTVTQAFPDSNSSPDITLGISGVQSSTAINSISTTATVSNSLTGVGGTTFINNVGTVSVVSLGITGTVSSLTAGVVGNTSSVSIGITGIQSVTAVGIETAAISYGLSGVESATSVGNTQVVGAPFGTLLMWKFFTTNASPDLTLGITGVSASPAINTVVVGYNLGLTGNQANSAINSITSINSISIGITGNVITSGIGSVTTSATSTTAVTGNSTTSATGTVTAASGNSVAISGITLTAGTGSLTTSAITSSGLTGVLSTASIGTALTTEDDVSSLTGVSLTGSAGSVGFTVGVNITLGGNSSLVSIGTLVNSATATRSITGVALNTSTGTVTAANSLVIGLTGNAAGSASGFVTSSSAISLSLSGNTASGTVGKPYPEKPVSVSGNTASGTVGNIQKALEVRIGLGGVTASGFAALMHGLINFKPHNIVVDSYTNTYISPTVTNTGKFSVETAAARVNLSNPNGTKNTKHAQISEDPVTSFKVEETV